MIIKLIFLLLISQSFSYLQPIQNHPSNLTKFMCGQILVNANETVAIVELQNNFSTSFVDELSKCVAGKVVMVHLDLRKSYVGIKLKHLRHVLLIGDEVDKNIMHKLVSDDNPKSILNHMAKFLVVTSKLTPIKRQKTMEQASDLGILNFDYIFEDKKGEIKVETYFHFTNTTRTFNSPSNDAELFPNKLENFNNTVLNVLAFPGMPDVEFIKKKLFSPHTNLLDLISEKRNAKIELKITQNFSSGQTLLKNKQIDLILSKSDISPKSALKSVVSYTEYGFCALIPIPESPQVLFYSMYNSISSSGRTLIYLQGASIMILWRIIRAMGQARGSSWYIIFALYANFLGQPFNIRPTRSMMKGLVMICFLGDFIMNNFYQASLTTHLTQPMPPHYISTISELFSPQNHFIVSLTAHNFIIHISEYQKAYDDGRVIITKTHIDEKDEIQIFRCENIEKFLRQGNSRNYYVYPHRLISFYIIHGIVHMSPYKENFQELVTQAYSSGLNHAWENFYMLEISQFEKKKFIKVQEEEDNMILNLKLIAPAIAVLPIGCLLAFLVLMIEIFHHDFYRYFSWQKFMEKSMWKEKKIKVRRIQVKPINETDM